MEFTFRVFLAVALAFTGTLAFPSFANEIPNGSNVPDPCVEGEFWPGVGHINRAGGGGNNQFGLDFKAAGYQWTPRLCRQDSDGDGISNGDELGDPNCVWQKGQSPEETTCITHPGIAEGSLACNAR